VWGRRRPEEADVDPPVEQRLRLMHRPQVLQPHLDVGAPAAECAHHIGKGGIGRRGDVADDELPDLATLGPSGRAHRALGAGERLPRLEEERLARRRQLDAPLRAAK
jgi:hypothetical protein